MRTISPGLKSAFSATPRTLAWLGKFVFSDGTVVRVSTHGADIDFDDGDGTETWTPDNAFKVSTLTSRGNGDVPDGEVVAPVAMSVPYTAEDVFIGKFEGMDATLYLIDYTDPTDGFMQIGPEMVSDIDNDDQGKIASFEVRGVLQRSKEITVEENSVACRSTLGDQRPGHCNLPLYPDDRQDSTAYTVGDYIRVSDAGNYHNRMFRCTNAGTTASSDPGYDYDIGDTTTDGTAEFICENAWVRSAVVATVTNNGDFTLTITEARAVDGWFELGAIKWLTGNNAGQFILVRRWTQSTARVQTWGTAYKTVQVGDTLEMTPGCDKAAPTCRTKFDNYINYRGEEYLPGPDFLSSGTL